MRAVQLSMSGRVQGVYYRMSARQEALRLGLQGWVRNTADGDVEAYAMGADEALDKFTTWCRIGPPAARVTGFTVNEAPIQEKIRGFAVTS